MEEGSYGDTKLDQAQNVLEHLSIKEVRANCQRVATNRVIMGPVTRLPTASIFNQDAPLLDDFREDDFHYVTTTEEFCDVIANDLATADALGVDIENSDHTYEGEVSLIQISKADSSGKIHTYVFDMLRIFSAAESSEMRADLCRDFMGSMLFENPSIVKVFHGAVATWQQGGGDLGWIQRDLGVRCVNLFDTQEFYKDAFQSN
mmetsp:Transcript_15180/g.23430  ORF Transcript_15180/g.23430 Transcript_15180/m.23430 type:complete len:204 (-) Transcript_15180:331-942(-)